MADLNVKFLKGSASGIANFTGNSVQGAFYLAEDICKLYYGTGTGAPVPLNEQVTVVDSVAKLPNPARAESILYYAKAENILCISSGTAEKGWIQINPDTDTDISINSFTVSAGRQDGNDLVFDLTLIEQDKDGNIKTGNGQDIGKFTGQIRITPDMIASLSIDVAVKTTSAAVTGNATVIKTSGTGADTQSGVTVKGGTNVSITGKENEIIVSAKDTIYELSNDGAAKVVLKDVDGTPAGQVAFEAGTALDVAAEDGKITYSHSASGVVAATYEGSSTFADNVATIQIPSFTVDAQGHVTAASKKGIKVTDSTFSADAVSADNTGKIKFSIANQDGTTTEATSGQDLYYTISIDGAEAKTVYNQGFLGNFYSKSAIDSKFKGLDAFTYKGTVANADELNAKTNVTIGDTYKASAGFVLNGENVHIGDIIIANGTEDASGVITNVEWDVIHSENNTDTTYTLTAADNKITLEDSNNTPQDITLADDDVVLLTSSGNTITASHAQVGANKTVGGNGGSTDYSGSIIVPQITVDEYGHVTAAEDKTYTLPREHEYSFEIDADNETLYLLEDTDRKSTLDFDGDNWISADLSTITKGGKLAITHKDVARTNSTATKNVDYGQTFTAITSLVSDAKGHVTGATTTTVTLPAETIYSLSGKLETVTGGVKVTDTLTGKNGLETTSVFNLVSSNDNLKVSASGDTITMNLVWGTF